MIYLIINATAPFLSFSENLDSGACQVKNLKREKLSDFLGLTDIFFCQKCSNKLKNAARPDKIAQTAGD